MEEGCGARHRRRHPRRAPDMVARWVGWSSVGDAFNSLGGGDVDSERRRAVVEQLKALGVRGILLIAAEEGLIPSVACQMPTCLCPEELGGRTYFEPVPPELPDWMPTHEHSNTKKAEGGQRTLENTLLAHRLCNRVDYAKSAGRPYAKDLERVEAARRKAIEQTSE
jgi:hypothetical protein